MTNQAGSDKKPIYKGYHETWDLPYKRGNFVAVPKGTLIRSTNPRKSEYKASKRYVVRVHHLNSGVSIPRMLYKDYDKVLYNISDEAVQAMEEKGTPIPVSNPEVVWSGDGQYWFWADINEVEKVEDSHGSK